LHRQQQYAEQQHEIFNFHTLKDFYLKTLMNKKYLQKYKFLPIDCFVNKKIISLKNIQNIIKLFKKCPPPVSPTKKQPRAHLHEAVVRLKT
jgi:hypothetical protein